MGLNRRDALKGAVATAAVIACEAIAPAAVVPKQACGCPRVHELAYGHTCTVHDETGKRWDAWTLEEIAAQSHDKLELQTEKTEWNCYCGRHGEDDLPPVGTACIWRKTSYEYDEWECDCGVAYREAWLAVVTTDWIAMMKEDGLLGKGVEP
ncbi:hypothetical protein [Bradyrhizobium liaoningense]